MSKLDTAWAISEIDAFLSVTAQINPNRPGSGMVYLGTVMRGPSTEADARAHVVEQILDRVIPQWKTERPEKDKEYRWASGPGRTSKSRARTP